MTILGQFKKIYWISLLGIARIIFFISFQLSKDCPFRTTNAILPTLNQRQNLMLKQHWPWVDTENNFILMLWYSKKLWYSIIYTYRSKDNPFSKLKQRHFVNVKSKSKFNVEATLILGWHGKKKIVLILKKL